VTMGSIDVDIRDGIATATISAPPVNAIDAAMRAELAEHVLVFERDPSVRAVLIRGDGERAFCAGFDLTELATTVGSADRTREQLRTDGLLFGRLAGCSKPTLASVAGLALGGGLEIAVCCDFIIAGERARFGLPEIKIGGYPAGGATMRVTKLVGAIRAKRLMLLGDPIDASLALQWGLISFVVPDAELAHETALLASRLAAAPALAVQHLKRAIAAALVPGEAAALDVMREGAARLALSDDLAAGVRSFRVREHVAFRDGIDLGQSDD
jgi:enoyl-CoA hydratase